MIALYIGRFQPFHYGHLYVIQEIKSRFEVLYLGVGSSQYSYTVNNPFTFDERKRMIEETLDYYKIENFIIYGIPDIHNYPKWVDHVKSIVPSFNVIVSNNSITHKLFSEKNYQVKNTTIFKRHEYSGKEIRRRIINDESWEDLVPKQVYNIINEINGVERIKGCVKE